MWTQEHSLDEVIDPKNFKPYTELKTKLYRVLDITADAPVAPSPMESTTDDLDLGSLATAEPETPAAESPMASSVVEDDDDDLSIFKELARS